MDCKPHNSTNPRPSLLALIDAQGGDLGATLLRLAHRAAAAHRFEHAASANAMRDGEHSPRITTHVSHPGAAIHTSEVRGGTP